MCCAPFYVIIIAKGMLNVLYEDFIYLSYFLLQICGINFFPVCPLDVRNVHEKKNRDHST